MQVEYMNKSIAEADWKELEELVAPLVIGYKDIVGDWINKKGLILTQYSSDWSTITE